MSIVQYTEQEQRLTNTLRLTTEALRAVTEECDAQRKVLEQALEALQEWAALIQHSYTGTSKGMTDLQYADNNGQKAITAIQEQLK